MPDTKGIGTFVEDFKVFQPGQTQELHKSMHLFGARVNISGPRIHLLRHLVACNTEL